ncbi:Rsp5p-dependent ubiquitination, sorting of cargo proteins at the multivesicular body [Gonapodya sp. JEL0774]|nr:Rsp5p-dependent ubiquitination, sorting of cargo proteins at the multivesicular body [Gonapodya sp. JEL0774]
MNRNRHKVASLVPVALFALACVDQAVAKGGGAKGGGGGSSGSTGSTSGGAVIVPVGGVVVVGSGTAYNSGSGGGGLPGWAIGVIVASIVLLLILCCVLGNYHRKRTARRQLAANSQALISKDAPKTLEEMMGPAPGSTEASYQNASNDGYKRGKIWMEAQGITPDTGRGPVPGHLVATIADKSRLHGQGAAWRFAPLMGTEAAARIGVTDEAVGKSVIVFSPPHSWTGGDTDISVLTDLPLWYLVDINQARTPFFYFEVTVITVTAVQRGGLPVIAVGLSTSPYPPFRLPGWHPHSVAYHSDDGRLFVSDPFGGRPFGPAYGPGDVIGVGYYPATGATFFTRNGALIPSGTGTPTVGWDGTHVPNDGCYSVVWGEKTVHGAVGSDSGCTLKVDFVGPFRYKPANPDWWTEAEARGWSTGPGIPALPVLVSPSEQPPTYVTTVTGEDPSSEAKVTPPKY